jgi:hypothetical protein
MSLLTEIQAAATDPSQSTADLLRKCQILAFRLRHEPFKQWVSHELNGYPDEATLPTYRGPFQADIKADTHGAFGSGVRNVGVPDWSFPADYREKAKQMAFYQGVGTLESLIEQRRLTSVAWHPSLVHATAATSPGANRTSSSSLRACWCREPFFVQRKPRCRIVVEAPTKKPSSLANLVNRAGVSI